MNTKAKRPVITRTLNGVKLTDKGKLVFGDGEYVCANKQELRRRVSALRRLATSK